MIFSAAQAVAKAAYWGLVPMRYRGCLCFYRLCAGAQVQELIFSSYDKQDVPLYMCLVLSSFVSALPRVNSVGF
jgi:hypothetical protein